MNHVNIDELLKTYPRKRRKLPEEYEAIYEQHYMENRNGSTKASNASSRLEGWLHKKVAKSASKDKITLEIGAGTLNQLKYEKPGVYDIVEPFADLYRNIPELKMIRRVYEDISELGGKQMYDRITSIACFEHIENLPDVVKRTTQLLKPNGTLHISIPNEGRFLWKLGYSLTTGREFKKRFGLEYETLMRYEHINTADEIEAILKYYFKSVKMKLFGIGKNLSFYRYYECSEPYDRSL